MIILIILIILVLLSFNLFRNLFKNDVTILDDVKLKKSEPSNNGFALMLEQDDGTYEESNSSTWPSDMKFNSELSGCIDINGNIIEDALEYDSSNNIMNVSVGETAYCYVYFDKFYFTDYLINNASSSDLWNSTLEGDGYRYVGTDPSNYICFGTTDKDMCLNDTDKYMYRIIGIFEDSNGKEHIKLILNSDLGKGVGWLEGDDEGLNIYGVWNEGDLYKGLNGFDVCDTCITFVNSNKYSYMEENSVWYNKIAVWDYTMTYTSSEVYYYSMTSEEVYLHELNKSSKTTGNGTWANLSTRISLIYASDYVLSLGSSALNFTGANNYNELKTSWLYYPSTWTMTQYDYNCAWIIHDNGYIDYFLIDGSRYVYPVFYLTSDVEYSSGTGTITDPFIIKE